MINEREELFNKLYDKLEKLKGEISLQKSMKHDKKQHKNESKFQTFNFWSMFDNDWL